MPPDGSSKHGCQPTGSGQDAEDRELARALGVSPDWPGRARQMLSETKSERFNPKCHVKTDEVMEIGRWRERRKKRRRTPAMAATKIEHIVGRARARFEAKRQGLRAELDRWFRRVELYGRGIRAGLSKAGAAKIAEDLANFDRLMKLRKADDRKLSLGVRIAAQREAAEALDTIRPQSRYPGDPLEQEEHGGSPLLDAGLSCAERLALAGDGVARTPMPSRDDGGNDGNDSLGPAAPTAIGWKLSRQRSPKEIAAARIVQRRKLLRRVRKASAEVQIVHERPTIDRLTLDGLKLDRLTLIGDIILHVNGDAAERDSFVSSLEHQQPTGELVNNYMQLQHDIIDCLKQGDYK